MRHLEHQKTAVLVFARSASEETNHKFINQGELLFDALTEDTLTKVKRSKLPYFHYTESQQQGKSFGERFANAIHSVFSLGFEQIITIGNDSPELKSQHILKAARTLSNGKNILGPSADGGFYLLGLKKEAFNKTEFIGLPWQTRNLFKATLAQLHLSKETLQLGFLADIDTIADIKLLLKRSHSFSKRWCQLFNSVMNKSKLLFTYVSQVIEVIQHPTFDLTRGSPVTIIA